MTRPATGQVIERNGARGRTFALRFRAYGKRHHITTRAATRTEAETELANILADVRRGLWQPPKAAPIVEETPEEPTFHELSSEWVAARTHEVDDRTVEHWRWALSVHLLPHLKDYRPSQITVGRIEAYKADKLAEETALSNNSINKTLKVLAQVLDYAKDLGYIDGENPARGRKRRLRATKPSRSWLEADEVRDLLKAAGENRALLATLALAGLRVGTLCALRWRAVDLARGTLRVEDDKTDAGRRTVDLSPDLLDELKAHRAKQATIDPDALVFPTAVGTKRDRSNLLRDVLRPAIKAANEKRAEAELPPIADGVTNHTLRRPFASLLYEAGASPAYVMAQMGHTSADLALEVYARKMERKRDTGQRMDALIRGADWAQMGTNESATVESMPALATENLA
jgi:integrase